MASNHQQSLKQQPALIERAQTAVAVDDNSSAWSNANSRLWSELSQLEEAIELLTKRLEPVLHPDTSNQGKDLLPTSEIVSMVVTALEGQYSSVAESTKNIYRLIDCLDI